MSHDRVASVDVTRPTRDGGRDATGDFLIGPRSDPITIDFALEAEREEGKAPEEAIYQASLLRFRPIMMTTMAALLGGLPLALGRGTGSELRHPLGITIVGGLILSQLLTLYTTPVVYLWFDRLSQRFSKVKVGNRIEEPVSEVHAD